MSLLNRTTTDVANSRKRLIQTRKLSQCFVNDHQETFGYQPYREEKSFQSCRNRLDSLKFTRQTSSTKSINSSHQEEEVDVKVENLPQQEITINQTFCQNQTLKMNTLDSYQSLVSLPRQSPYEVKRKVLMNKSGIVSNLPYSPRRNQTIQYQTDTLDGKENRTFNKEAMVAKRQQNKGTGDTRVTSQEHTQLRNQQNKLIKDHNKLKAMYTQIDNKLQDAYLKLTTYQQINESLEQELRTQKQTLSKIDHQRRQLEQTNNDLNSEIQRMQRAMINGSKGQVIAEQNRELRERLRIAEEQRDRTEEFFNERAYEFQQKDATIKQLETLVQNFQMTIRSDEPQASTIPCHLQDELAQEKRLRQKLADRVSELDSQLKKARVEINDLKMMREGDNQEIIRLESELVTANQQIGNLSEQKVSLQRECDLQKEEVNDLIKTNQSLEDKIVKLNLELSNQESEIDGRYKQQILEMDLAISELSQAYQSIQTKIAIKVTSCDQSSMTDRDSLLSTRERILQQKVDKLQLEIKQLLYERSTQQEPASMLKGSYLSMKDLQKSLISEKENSQKALMEIKHLRQLSSNEHSLSK